ncbi:MAG TPA: hypothetical protein VKU02_29360 [Gemmataceae bacterium]|nr:hypothetical protein [Gemmataceae bacterium]
MLSDFRPARANELCGLISEACEFAHRLTTRRDVVPFPHSYGNQITQEFAAFRAELPVIEGDGTDFA